MDPIHDSVRLFIGIDPGKDGGIVWMTENGALLAAIKTPIVTGKKRVYDVTGMRDVLLQYPREKSFASVEKSAPMPRQFRGGAAQFQRGYGLGIWEGLLSGLGIPYLLVHPRTWQSEMLRDVDKSDTKQASVVVAKRMWPDRIWTRSSRGVKDDPGLTDAALIAEWGRRRAAWMSRSVPEP